MRSPLSQQVNKTPWDSLCGEGYARGQNDRFEYIAASQNFTVNDCFGEMQMIPGFTKMTAYCGNLNFIEYSFNTNQSELFARD